MKQQWHKSSYSGANNNCVEVREQPESVGIRDTQNREHGHLVFVQREWAGLIASLRTTD